MQLKLLEKVTMYIWAEKSFVNVCRQKKALGNVHRLSCSRENNREETTENTTENTGEDIRENTRENTPQHLLKITTTW